MVYHSLVILPTPEAYFLCARVQKTKPPSSYTGLPLLILHLTPSPHSLLTFQLWLSTASYLG